MRVIYLGTPEFAVPTLERLLDWPKVEVVALLTQPDRPAGRGNKVIAPPTKLVLQSRNIPVFQPEKLSRSPEIVQAMRDLKPDVLVMVAFGQILKKEVLTMAPLGVVNLHGSILPKYRGAAPINWAVINGETVTGSTTMFSDVGVDTGPMLLKQEIPVLPDMTAEELSQVMAVAGAELVIETLEGLQNGTVKPIVQDDSEATFAPRLTKDMGQLDWSKSAQDIHNLVRGLFPWPGTTTTLEGATVKVIKTRVPAHQHAHTGSDCRDSVHAVRTTDVGGTVPDPQADNGSHPPGTIIKITDGLLIACGPDGKDVVEVLKVQPPGKPVLDAKAWANGARLKVGTAIGTK